MTNLLPLKEKKELLTRKTQKIIIIFIFLFSLFLLSLILSLLAIKFYVASENFLQKTLFETAKQELESPKNQALREEIVSLNQDVSQILSFYQERINLTNVLEKITKAMPPNISLRSFSYEERTLLIKLTGFAPTREELALFRENLKKREEFSNISFPPQNWVKATDINFFVSLELSF